MELVYRNEKTLFPVMLGLSVLAWVAIALATRGMALAYALLFFLIYCFARSAVISRLRGDAAMVTYMQFPDLHTRIQACCERLGLDAVPDAYVVQMGGALRCQSTRFFGQDFLLLYSDLVDAFDDNPDALSFYIGQEIGRIKRRHLRWAPLLLPAAVLPLLGTAYARARTYTADRHGLAACENEANAQFALAALAAGSRRWRSMSKTVYVSQSARSGQFWMSFHELLADSPWMVKRMSALRDLSARNEVTQPGRHPLAFALALLVPRVGFGGTGMVVVMAAIGSAIALAVPMYQDYVTRHELLSAVASGHRTTDMVEKYYIANGTLPLTLEAAGASSTPRDAGVELLRFDSRSGALQVMTTYRSEHGQGMLNFALKLDDNKRMNWVCSADDIEVQFRPSDCQ